MADRDRRDRDDDDDRGRGRSRSRDDDDNDSGGRGWRYKPSSAEDVKHRGERNTSGNDPFLADALKVFKPRQGDNTIRFLPATWEDSKHYGLDVFVHFGIGPDRAAYLCLDKMKGKPCPICEARKRAVAEGDQEFADELRPSARVIAYVIDRDKDREGALVWGMSARQDSEIARLAVDKQNGEALNVDSPDEGYDLTFTREGEGLKTRYSGFAFSRRSSSLDHKKALQFAIDNPLADALVFYSYDHIAKSFAGTKARSDDDDDKPSKRGRDRDDDKPAARRGRDDDERPARRPRDDDDDKPKRAAKPDVDMTWDEVHELSFRKLTNLIEEHSLKVDPEASRNDEDLADQVCEELGIEKRAARRASRDDDERPARREVKKDDDEPVTRRKLREARGD
jgi:hypothetical protein